MRELGWLLGAVLTCAAACDGCDGCRKAPPRVEQAAPRAEPVDPAEAPEKLGRTARINVAMQCLRRHSAHVFEAQRAYLEKVDAAKGPAAGVKPVLLEMYGIDDCRDDTARATAALPAIPELDAPLREYVRALQEYGDRFRALSSFYVTRERKDWARAGDLHASLMSAFGAFSAAHAALEAQVKGSERQSDSVH
jgi:hypothetical protein